MLWELWEQWVWLAGAALGIATVLVSLVYMLSEFFMNDKMKLWAKMELTEIFYSAIIISMAIFGLTMIDQVVYGSIMSGNMYDGPLGPPTSAAVFVEDPVTHEKEWRLYDICGSGPGSLEENEASPYHNIHSCHIKLGIWYLREVFDETKNFAFDVYISYIFTSILAEFTINIEFLFEQAGFFTFTPWRGFFTIGNTIKSQVFSWAIKIMMITKFQEIMLSFIAKALFPAFFVMGAILRTFAFTRRLGGLLLAMALALYFIFPAFYAFGGLVMLNIKHDPQVIAAWNHPDNADARARAGTSLNPPIANSMYMTGNFSMIGGDGKFSYEEARANLSHYEGATEEDYMRWIQQRGVSDEDNDAMGRLIKFDLSNDTAYEDDQDKNDSYRRAYEMGRAWFNNVSKEGKFDSWVTMAWEPNGPIETLSRLTFWSVFFSLFSIIGTIAGIRSLSMTFGGDIEIAGLTRLI